MSIKLDLHVHSESRGRIFINEQQLVNSLRQNRLDGVAITNFNDISHAVWLKEKIEDYIVIVGQEIWTKDGHIVGLGLKERIADAMDVEKTIQEIHRQGGIAVAVHPYLYLGLGKKMASVSIDAVEVYNALTGVAFIHNYLARRTAERLNLPQLASTDISDARFIGRSYTEVITDDKASVLESIRAGRVKLFKRAMPVPIGFILGNFLALRDLEPCSFHAMPCFICGKSMSVRLFKEKFECLDCKKSEFSRIACCNGHYLCKSCLLKRALNKNTDYSQGQ